MREILFRGKRTNNGAWVNGFLVDEKHIGNWLCSEPIDPETVGQFTGLTDKNGEKIFEGDIVRCLIPVEVEPPPRNGDVCWGTYGWVVDFHSPYTWDSFGKVGIGCVLNAEVIGNIHDNPELLEGDEQNVYS